MQIAVYSGSFNPLHIGHQAIMERLTEAGRFDCVYLIVSPQNPFKSASNAASGEQRYHAALEAVGRHPGLRVKVDDIELQMSAPHYTIRTLDALREREPENDFTLVIGADNLALMPNWRDYKRVLLEYGVIVFPREGHDVQELKNALLAQNPDYKIQLIDAPLVNMSSTEVRKRIALGEDVSGLLM